MISTFKRAKSKILFVAAVLMIMASVVAHADMAPDTFIKQMSSEVINAVKANNAVQGGDLKQILTLVDTKIVPHVNLERLTASTVGRYWRQATAEQKKRLQDEFKLLLVYTYAGGLRQARNQVVEIKPLRAQPDDSEVDVRTLVKDKGDPIQLDYRLQKTGSGWKIYDFSVNGDRLVEDYRRRFAQEISAAGIDGLINYLVKENATAAANR
jgi:phospholipid transport system substrate-binding protein